MISLSVSAARASLPDILDRVDGGEEVTITRHGRPVAVVVRPDVLRVRRAASVLGTAQQVGDLLATARATPRSAAGTVTAERADKLIADLRAGREAP